MHPYSRERRRERLKRQEGKYATECSYCLGKGIRYEPDKRCGKRLVTCSRCGGTGKPTKEPTK